jgi:hypothetical protein
MEVGFLPARASQASTVEGLHARRVCSFSVSRHQLGVRRPDPSSADRTPFPKAIPERRQGASIADHLFNQPLFWTALAGIRALLVTPRNAVSRYLAILAVPGRQNESTTTSSFEPHTATVFAAETPKILPSASAPPTPSCPVYTVPRRPPLPGSGHRSL